MSSVTVGAPSPESTSPESTSPGTVAAHARSTSRARRRRPVTARRIGVGIGIALLAAFIFGPLLWLMLWAFAGVWHYPSLLPQSWSLSWWRQIFHYPQLVRSVGLSFTFAPIVTLVSAVVCLPAAYALARFPVPGRRTLLVVLFATQILFAMLTKAAPQMNVWILGMPLQIFLALVLVAIGIGVLPNYVTAMLTRAIGDTAQLFVGR